MHYVFIIFLLSFLAANVYIFTSLQRSVLMLAPFFRWSIYIFYWICVSLLPLTFVLTKVNLPEWLAQSVHRVGTGWLVFTLYMTIVLLLLAIVQKFFPSFKHGFWYALTGVCVVLGVGFYNYYNPKIVEIDIDLKNYNAEAGETFRIVGVSDIHLGYGTNKTMLRRYVNQINKQEADLVIISGDIIDNSIIPVEQQAMHEELNAIISKNGVYACLGNHEYIGGIKSCYNFLKSTNIKVLKDEVVTLNNGMQIIGRDDATNRNRKSVEELCSTLDKQLPSIMLDHQPKELQQVADAGVGLMLNGHTHRGQVWPISLIVDKMFERSYGYEKRKDSHIYVSSGIGLWGPPFRIGTQSEIVVFNVR